ncbi:MAG: hypothetical protein N2C14_05255, partial [Planctomycetales bacterium]
MLGKLFIRVALCASLVILGTRRGEAQPRNLPPIPAPRDQTAASMRRVQQGLLSLHGNNDRGIPLEVKAEHFEWLVWRYHMAPYHQCHTRVLLPKQPGEPVRYLTGSDVSTWNGCLLAALSYKYAVTKDPGVLAQISRLLHGIHLYIEVTGKPGLVSRCVVARNQPEGNCTARYATPDGRVFHYAPQPAKGTYNQLMLGYAALWMNAYQDLPPDVQQRASQDAAALALHLVDHDYQLTEKDGNHSPWGGLTPRIGSFGVPFNAQVAYLIVASGSRFPAPPGQKSRLISQYRHLRHKHHVYYEKPFHSLVLPQKIGAHPLVKGMNDRNHVCNAAFMGLCLEMHAANTQGRPVDAVFLYQLGQTRYW